MNEFIKTIKYPRVCVDFSNDWILGDNKVLLSKENTMIDSAGNEIFLYEGLQIYAYEENEEFINNLWVKDNIIANGICTKNNNQEKINTRWLLTVDKDGIHYMSEFS